MSQEDFLFGSKSALKKEEFNVLKTNRFKSKQKRILVIENTSIYHKKQVYDPISGQIVEAENNIPQPLNQTQDAIESPSPL